MGTLMGLTHVLETPIPMLMAFRRCTVPLLVMIILSTWLGLASRDDVVMSDIVRKKLAKARINTILSRTIYHGYAVYSR